MAETDCRNDRLNNCRNALLVAKAQADERARIGKINAEKLKEADRELNKLTTIRDNLRECMNYITGIYKNIEKYAADRKELSTNMLKTAIEKAGLIVPDASAKGIHLDYKNKEALIVDDYGTDVNLREGSAYRTVLCMLMRYTLLKVQPDALQVLFLDEMFSTLSDETINTMREYIEVFKEDILIVGIEQRDVLFQGINKTTFEAVKTDGVTTIRKVE